jgi:hypothetical protein
VANKDSLSGNISKEILYGFNSWFRSAPWPFTTHGNWLRLESRGAYRGFSLPGGLSKKIDNQHHAIFIPWYIVYKLFRIKSSNSFFFQDLCKLFVQFSSTKFDRKCSCQGTRKKKGEGPGHIKVRFSHILACFPFAYAGVSYWELSTTLAPIFFFCGKSIQKSGLSETYPVQFYIEAICTCLYQRRIWWAVKDHLCEMSFYVVVVVTDKRPTRWIIILSKKQTACPIA